MMRMIRFAASTVLGVFALAGARAETVGDASGAGDPEDRGIGSLGRAPATACCSGGGGGASC